MLCIFYHNFFKVYSWRFSQTEHAVQPAPRSDQEDPQEASSYSHRNVLKNSKQLPFIEGSLYAAMC